MQITLITYLTQEVWRLSQAKRFGQSLRVESVRNSLSRFFRIHGIKDVTMPALTSYIICIYQQWLTDNGLKKNSVSCYMRTLQSIYNKAMIGLPAPAESPFIHAYRGIAKTKKRAASISVMQKLQALDIHQGLIKIGKQPGHKAFSTTLNKMLFARDLFIFCYCAQGMAFVDAAYLKKQDVRNGIIHYHRRKTGQLIEVAIEPIMQEIIDRYAESTEGTPYLFPILPQADEKATYHAYRTALRTHNSRLKMLSGMLDEDICLSSYVARHSWASNMHEMNMPLSIISQGLGHDSELTTQIYIKSLENSVIHEANRAFVNHVFSHPFLPMKGIFFGKMPRKGMNLCSKEGCLGAENGV